MRVVLDASILIDEINDRGGAHHLLSGAIERQDELWSSFVVRTEVLAGMRVGEEERTLELLHLIRWAGIDELDSDVAGEFGRRFARSRPGIDTPDLLLAALAQRLGARLLTMNVKHFPMFPGLKPPYSY